MDRGATWWPANDITQYSIACNTVNSEDQHKLGTTLEWAASSRIIYEVTLDHAVRHCRFDSLHARDGFEDSTFEAKAKAR
jgi:hypothetical protein